MIDTIYRYKLKVYIKGEPIIVHKSDDHKYIERLIEGYKAKQTPDQVEFRRNKSEVRIINKPDVIFKNLPNWRNVNYGINSDGGYYLINNDTDKVIRIYEL